jgi:hypothetical protein
MQNSAGSATASFVSCAPLRSRSLIRWLAFGIAVSCLGFVVISVWSQVGSFSALLSYVRGDSLYIDSPIVELGELTPNHTYTVRATVRNISNSAVAILGARTDCGCITVSGVPTDLQSGDTTELVFSVASGATSERDKIMERVVTLFTNRTGSVDKTIRIRGRVRSSEPDALSRSTIISTGS